MLDYKELREVVDRIENNKDKWYVNFIVKYPAIWIYEKIGWTEYQLVIDMKVKVLVCIKLIMNLLKLKPKTDKTMMVITIDRFK